MSIFKDDFVNIELNEPTKSLDNGKINFQDSRKYTSTHSIEDIKRIHGIMTFLVEKESGRFRSHGEGVYDGEVLIFMCPPARMINTLMEQLFDWLNEAKDRVHPLILSSVFHYEFVFIHPFGDGNGRMASKLGITRDGISYNIKQLKDNGIIERIGSTKKGSWRVLTN